MRAVWILTVLWFCGCGGGRTQDAGQAAAPLSSCAPGWWLGTSAVCGASCPGPVECAAQDCLLQSFLGLLVDGTSIRGSMTISNSMRSFSSWGRPTSDQWTLTDMEQAISLAAGQGGLGATCSSSLLKLEGAPNRRAETTLSNALAKALQDDQWSSVRF
jgi:hypothetical protein